MAKHRKQNTPKTGNKRNLRIVCFLIVAILILDILSAQYHKMNFNDADNTINAFENDPAQFRNHVIKYVRYAANNHLTGKPAYSPNEPDIRGDWKLDITIYHKGEIKGKGTAKNNILSEALNHATIIALQNINTEELKDSRFKVTITSPIRHSFIEHNEQGKELIGDLVVIRDMDENLIREKIKQGKKYLLSVIDKDKHGAHKYYYAKDDRFENRLHTIYTSSLLYTLLKIYDYDKDEQIWQQISDSSEFILAMQNKDKESKRYGAFHYSYYPDTGEKEQKYVVGTTSKTIFTLLELYNRTGSEKYLESAKLGADWLLTMQNPDGSMKPYVRYRDNKWYSSKSESLLYNGQVLSALSRMYRVTGKQEYYDAAHKIAERHAQKVEKKGCYLGDDFRVKNPISSSWVILALYDFYKIDYDEYHKNMIFTCSEELLNRQISDPGDLANHGRIRGSYTTSGNGWLNEVMVEIYYFCKQEQTDADCEKYKHTIINITRWLIQDTYTEENTFILKNPKSAIGGLFWNHDNKYIRTDSVCHGLNAYAGIIDELEDGPLLSIPE